MERKALPFVRRGHSVRTKEKKNRDEEGGALSRWLRELRGEPKPAPPPERSNPIYHSEGKGLRSRKHGKRRHSFQHHHRCCGDEDGGGKRGSAMTGETATSNGPYILNTSPTLKTVMEREKFLPGVDREGKSLGEPDYTIPSPPERDTSHLDTFTKYTEIRLSQLSIDGGYDGSQSSLTRAELEQYSRAYEEVRAPSHSQQPSYAQSEGYHSYVSSSDSTTTTPFLDRLRRENETGRESSASSGSSSETLKWHGSLSDVSSTPQHIAHSARVPMPQRHHSESVLYLEPWPQPVSNNNMRRLFPVSTYEPTAPRYILSNDRSPPKLSVAERICEIERRGNNDDKRRGMTDHASLKAIQKKALLSFYERHASAWKSEPQLTAPSIPPQPPPRPPPQASRRSSSASDYAGALKRDIPRNSLDMSKSESNGMRDSKHQHSSSCGSLTTASLGPMIIGPSICVDDWVPARPPKKPHLRAAYPHPPRSSSPVSPNIICRPDPPYPVPRPASPEPPPPSPPPPPEAETYPDEPLPPPPPEVQQGYTSRRYERAMNASLSLDNLTRSDKHSLLHSKSHDSCNDGFYENGMEIKRNEHNKNGFTYADKFNERFVENRIESMQSSYCDQLNELWDTKNYLDMRKYSEKKQPEAQVRTSILSPPLPNKKRSHNEQPRSLDSNLSLVECNNEVNKPGPQTPIHKKYSAQMNINGHDKQVNYKNIRENFLRAVSVPADPQLMKNAPERQSLRFTTSTQKLLVNGKIANAIHNGKISPPSRKANLVRTPSDVVRRVAGLHHAEPLGKNESLPKPTLPPHCPPTTLQLSQSKASYLSYRREPKEKEKGLPNFQGSYKRTMSPSGGRIIETSLDKPIEKVPDASPVSEEEKSINEKPKEEKQQAKSEEEPPTPNADSVCERDVGSKTLPRGYPIAGPAKSRARAPRAQSDPTCSTKVEKKTVSASTQDNLDEIVREEKTAAVVGRSQSDRTETRRVEEPRVSDASSQTTPTPSPPPTPPRRHLQEEIECDQLSRDLASQLSPSHKLHGILVPGPDVKRSTDYVSGLFRMDFAPRSRSSLVTSQTTTSTSTNTILATTTTQVSQTNAAQQTSTIKSGKESESPSSNNTYFTTPECKARLLSTTSNTQIDNTAPSSIGSLQQKKEELMMRLSRKLLVLKAESVAVTEETAVNEALGNAVCERVERVARPHEVSRFKLHVKEVGHITSLLLSLSGRLARAENGLLVLPPEHPDRKALEEKRDKLLAQLNEAKQLKSNIDQRSGSVSSMLYNYLTGEEYTDYDHFINMKSKLLVDSREIAEKIQLGEEQLAALKETLDQVR